jgi:hypothetical protein
VVEYQAIDIIDDIQSLPSAQTLSKRHVESGTERPPAKSWRVQKLSADLTAD